MENPTAAEIQRYLDDSYLTLEALAERAGVDAARVGHLIDAQCVPPHSHEVRGVTVFAGSFEDYAVAAPPRRYYHPSLVAWVTRAEDLAASHALAEVARLQREDFAREFTDALDGAAPPWPGGVDYAWRYLMDGTWGTCLKEISVSSLLQKERARQCVAAIAGRDPGVEPHAEERAALTHAVAQYERVTGSFAPHEQAKSSRRTEIAAAIRRFALAPTGRSPN